MMPRHARAEVIVIGAGAAGLAAGRRLAGAGKQVIILEARERIGGRIHTQRADQGKVPMELGAEFIHGLPTDSWSLIREAQLPTVELRGKAFCFDAQRLTVCDDRQHESFSVLEQMETWLEQRRSASDVTFEGYLRAAGVESSRGDLAAAYVEGFNAADRHIISATALVRQQRAEEEVQGDRIFHIRSGYDSLPQFLAEDSLRSGARIILGCPVRRIRWHRNSVSVEGCAADGAEFHFEAAQAVVALPLGVLQSNAVIFDPEPGEMARHWQSLRMGNAERIVLLFDRCFWSDVAPGQGFLFTPGEIFPTWWTAAPESTPLLTGWAGGAAAMARWQQAGMTKLEDLLPAALKTLAKVYGVGERQLQSWLVDSKFHNWQSDPFSRGAYSYVGLGGWEAARLLNDPVDDTLFFAGEHTDLNDQWGTVHAALSSGERAARKLMTKEPRRS